MISRAYREPRTENGNENKDPAQPGAPGRIIEDIYSDETGSPSRDNIKPCMAGRMIFENVWRLARELHTQAPGLPWSIPTWTINQ